MTVLLKGPPPIQQVAELNVPGAVEVYALLWESAFKDIRMDPRKGIHPSERRDCGGTSTWSITGIADKLHIGKLKVGKAITALLNSGYISVDGLIPTTQGSKKRQFRVTHPNQLEARQAAIGVMGTEYLDKTHTPRQWSEDVSSDSFLEFLEGQL